MVKIKSINWNKGKRRKGYNVCACGAVIKYCKCKEQEKRKDKND